VSKDKGIYIEALAAVVVVATIAAFCFVVISHLV
jgi:hypothetical protein